MSFFDWFARFADLDDTENVCVKFVRKVYETGNSYKKGRDGQ